MFGFRPDGRSISGRMDPITRLTPYIMTRRSDSQCFCTQYIDYDILNSYVKKKRAEGFGMSVMAVIMAAYVRAVSQFPELNRFVMGKKLYARRELCVSFAIVKERTRGRFLETTVKIYFDPCDTVYDVLRKVERAIAENKQLDDKNSTDRVAEALFAIPGLVGMAAAVLKGMDKIGLMPKAIIDASPFHTSMFITNMASLGMRELHHHLYDFGNTTAFFGLGRREAKLKVGRDGKIGCKYYYPLAIVVDERVAAGAMYGLAFELMDKMLRRPEMLESPPEDVRYDHKAEYRCKEDKIR
jgi:hypothetical protein